VVSVSDISVGSFEILWDVESASAKFWMRFVMPEKHTFLLHQLIITIEKVPD
jgi:hypothetical protein